MTLSLHPDQRIDILDERLKEIGGPSAVKELDLTNCVLVRPDRVFSFIEELTCLQSLRCLSCLLRPRDLLKLLLQRLPHLVEVEFTLVLESGAETEFWHLHKIRKQGGSASLVPALRRMYVEVGYDENFQILRMFLRSCPKLDDLHVHFVHGNFWKALLECHAFLAEHASLETFTFTSEQRESSHHDWFTPLRFTSCAALCANVNGKKSTEPWNCFRLHQLALDGVERRVLPSQLVAVVVDVMGGLMAESIRIASVLHDWTHVRQLCLVLFPAESTSVSCYPTAGGRYRDSLLHFFSKALVNLVELNVSSFHFGAGMELTDMLRDGSLKHLRSLSASPCGLRLPSSVHRLAKHCRDLDELDVRVERKGSFQRCAACDDFVADPSYALLSSGDIVPAFPDGLTRLTLSGLHGYGCLWFIKACGPTTTIRLSDCSAPWRGNYILLLQTLSDNDLLACLVLEHEHLDFTDTSLLNNLADLIYLEHLYLLSAKRLSDDVVENSLRRLCPSLPDLECLHVHYRVDDAGGCDSRMTWLRREITGTRCKYTVVKNSPCLKFCSTATFIGLAKPLNRRPAVPILQFDLQTLTKRRNWT
ncbi:hypothetical protein HPB50_016002 [Hyalomma asiaticum]|uniref:Uncharacterized protein n=1 Tax=Hyalomma asiaticum TaxID=266040 RepID=A0ACB7TAD9_HYAAI|nr:hypothetical protein HPB50_016002 [Hyalomma asiaticum]